jgi:uroporphyrinogen-III synthase
VTAEAATRLGIPVTVMPSEFTIGSLVQALADHYAVKATAST